MDRIACEFRQVWEAMEHSYEFREGAECGCPQIQDGDRREGGQKCLEAGMERDVRQRFELRWVGFPRPMRRRVFVKVNDIHPLEIGQLSGKDHGEKCENADGGV